MTASPTAPAPPTARRVAYDALRRIDHDGAYANLVVPATLERVELSDADRRFVTELVAGTTRMRRACDVLVRRFTDRPPDPDMGTLLRLGAYQLRYAGVPAHAAVHATVELAPRRARGFANAVLRRVAEHLDDDRWPSEAARLSYPDWIVDRLVAELGHDEAVAALERMNVAPVVSARDDGYVQDLASRWVVDAVGAAPGERVLDVCAAPGGKATALAATGADVVAGDVRPARAGLVVDNARRTGRAVGVVVADGRRPPFPSGTFDRVLLDAPCTGLGALRRRPDARWRISADDVSGLAGLQAALLAASASTVAPGGTLTYSVCTLLAAESTAHGVPEGFEVVEDPPPSGRWRPMGIGWRVLPHDADTDGMVVVRYRRRA